MLDNKIIDESCGYTDQRYILTRFYKIGTDRVRVKIQRDAYAFQSFAVADVLTPDRTWTDLVTFHPSTWLTNTPDRAAFRHPLSKGDIVRVLGILADALAEKAATILGDANANEPDLATPHADQGALADPLDLSPIELAATEADYQR